MRYRPLDDQGDYTVGVSFLVNTPEAVGQAVETRLGLWLGEFDLDQTDGTAYETGVLGKSNGTPPDTVIQARILGTALNGQALVTDISSYSSTYDGNTRVFTVSATIDTIYGSTTISTSVAVSNS